MEKTDLMKEYEIKIDSRVNWEAYPIGYTRYLESELIKARAKAYAYDRLMSGGKKKLKEWANILGTYFAVDYNGDGFAFPKKPVCFTDALGWDSSGGGWTIAIPNDLIDFSGDWKDSLTMPDGWEEK